MFAIRKIWRKGGKALQPIRVGRSYVDMLNKEWQDRARWFGIPILFTTYWIAGEMLYRRRGPLWITEDRLPLYRVLDVQVRKSPLDRLLGLGTVVVYAADVTDAEFLLKGIRQPDQVAETILTRANELRTTYGVRGREMYGAFMGEFGESR